MYFAGKSALGRLKDYKRRLNFVKADIVLLADDLDTFSSQFDINTPTPTHIRTPAPLLIEGQAWTGCIVAWYESNFKRDRRVLQRVVKVTQCITRSQLPSMQDRCIHRGARKAGEIIKDPDHKPAPPYTQSTHSYHQVNSVDASEPDPTGSETASICKPSH